MSLIQQERAESCAYTQDELIIIDPPYNIGYKYNGGFVDSMDAREYAKLFIPMIGHRVVVIHYAENLIEDVVPVLGIPERVIAWTYPSNMGSRQFRVVAWFNCKPDFKKYRVPYKNPKDKRIIELVKKTGGRALPDHWDINLVKNVSKEKIKGYTNQIPEEVIRRIIKTTAKNNDTITDVFCGTGTTPFIADKMGYNYIARDINPLAIRLTKERLKK